MGNYHSTFKYNSRGYGHLIIYENDKSIIDYYSRTGSIGKNGELKYQISPGVWRGQELSVNTSEPNMFFNVGKGWKYRLWYFNTNREYIWTRYLIHPSRHGTLGCITPIGTDALTLRSMLDNITLSQEFLPLTVSREV